MDLVAVQFNRGGRLAVWHGMAWLADDSRFASLDNLNAFYSAKLRCSSLNYVRTASVASPPACRVVSCRVNGYGQSDCNARRIEGRND